MKHIKKIISIILVLAFLVCSLFVQTPRVYASEEFFLEEHEVIMALDHYIDIYFCDANGERVQLTDYSVDVSDPDVISADGFDISVSIAALKPGKATVTVETDDGRYKDSCEVTVFQGLNYHYLNLSDASEPVQLVFRGLDDKIIEGEFSVIDENVVTVDGQGNVTVVGEGETEINFFAEADDIEYSDYCQVTVSNSYKVDPNELYFLPENSYPVDFYGPAGEMIKDAIITSSDSNVAYAEEFDDTYYINAINPGIAKITFTTPDGEHSAFCDVYVAPGLNYHLLDLAVGSSAKQLIFYDHAGKKVEGTFWSSNPSIAEVDEDGYVTPISEGEVDIIFYAANGIYSDLCTVFVEDINDYKLSETRLMLPAGGKTKLSLTGPNGAAAKCTWTSSNPSIVSVDAAGNVTAIKYGKATICAETADGFSAECIVQVLFNDAFASNMYYYKAIRWAADHKPAITKGFDLKYFGVGRECNRKDLAMFLYRMAGNPSVDISGAAESFSDISDLSDNFKKAITWSVEKEFFAKDSDGNFNPLGSVLREDAIIILWKYYGEIAMQDYSILNSFNDCQTLDEGSDAYKAIAWAASYGITNGYSTNVAGYTHEAPFFGNTLPIQREQMITFLYRAVQKFGESPR